MKENTPQDKASFEKFFEENYVPVEYKTVKNDFEEVAAEYGRDLFTEEYQAKGRIKKENYILYLTSDAYCAFEEIVENAVDALNQDIADVIAEIGNELSFDNSVTEIYFDNMEKLVKRFLDCLYDEVLCEISSSARPQPASKCASNGASSAFSASRTRSEPVFRSKMHCLLVSRTERKFP